MRRQFKRHTGVLLVILLIFTMPVLANADWDFSQHSINVADIMLGGPPKDGIPLLPTLPLSLLKKPVLCVLMSRF